MADDLQVLEDGVAPNPQPPPSRPSWLLGVVGFALGLGLGVVVIRPAPAEAPATTVSAFAVEESSPPATPATTVDATGPGVRDEIPGFPNAIVAVAHTTSTALDYLLWPLEGELRGRSIAGGDGVSLDVGSRFVAMSDDVPGLDGVLLSMGRYNSVQPVATGVTSYAWHDEASAFLSYSAPVDGGTGIFVVQADLASKPVAVVASPAAEIAGWGDWGWALQTGPSEIVLLNPDGEFKDSEQGVALATHPSGWVFVMEGSRPKLVSAGGGVRRIHAEPAVGTISDAAISPDRSLVAIAGPEGVELLDIESEHILGLSDVVMPSLSWSSDSSFVVGPAAGGAVALDVDAGTAYSILSRYTVLALGVIPLQSP